MPIGRDLEREKMNPVDGGGFQKKFFVGTLGTGKGGGLGDTGSGGLGYRILETDSGGLGYRILETG